jgi:hypothetical protein
MDMPRTLSVKVYKLGFMSVARCPISSRHRDRLLHESDGDLLEPWMPASAEESLARREVLTILLLLFGFVLDALTVGLLFNRAGVSDGFIQHACYTCGVLDPVAVFLRIQWNLRKNAEASEKPHHGGLQR